MDVLDLIKAEHSRVKTLFLEIESTDDPRKLYDCFNQLYNALNVHAAQAGDSASCAGRRRRDIFPSTPVYKSGGQGTTRARI